MDEETVPQATPADSPAQDSGAPPDIATGDLDAVVAAAARGDYDPKPDGGDAPADARGGRPDSQPRDGTAPAADDDTDYKRKYDSLSGNNYTLSQQNQALQRQLQETQTRQQQEFAAYQQQLQADYQRAMKVQSEEAQIRAALPDPGLQQQALEEYRRQNQADEERRQYEQGASAYVGYLRQQQDTINQSQLALAQHTLPQVVPGLARYIAAQMQAPEEPLVELVSAEEFHQVFPLVGRPPAPGMSLIQRDMDLVAAVVAGVAAVEGRRDSARRTANGQAAARSGQFRPDPDTLGRGDGLDAVARINAMDDKKFNAHVEALTRAAERGRAYS